MENQALILYATVSKTGLFRLVRPNQRTGNSADNMHWLYLFPLINSIFLEGIFSDCRLYLAQVKLVTANSNANVLIMTTSSCYCSQMCAYDFSDGSYVISAVPRSALLYTPMTVPVRALTSIDAQGLPVRTVITPLSYNSQISDYVIDSVTPSTEVSAHGGDYVTNMWIARFN